MTPLIPIRTLDRAGLVFLLLMSSMMALFFGGIAYERIGVAIGNALTKLALPPTGNVWAKLLAWHHAEWDLLGSCFAFTGIWMVATNLAWCSLVELHKQREP